MSKQYLQRAFLLMGIVLLLRGLVWGQAAPKGGHPDTTGWKDLFVPYLANAVVNPGAWVMEDGELSAKDGSTIWTKESYGNFVLDLEFKVSKGANSGVFLRAGDIKDVLSAFEIQIHENTDGTKYGMVGALYDAKPPGKNMAKPVGEWNRYTITFQDSRLSLVFNGEQVMNIDLNDWSEAHKNPDGTQNKFAIPLKDFARAGPVGLQGLHGRERAPVWFRNMKIKVLN